MSKVSNNISVILMISILFVGMKINGMEEEEAAFILENICRGNEKLAKIHFYVQDALAGPNPTVYEVARAPITETSVTSFGQVRVLDDLVTAGPDRKSTKVGRAQGLITFSDLETSALTMNLNIVFTSGKYNGSTIVIVGRNQIGDAERELAVGGGTGIFRFARGYATSTTYDFNVETNYGILEYTIYVAYLPNSNRHPYIADM